MYRSSNESSSNEGGNNNNHNHNLNQRQSSSLSSASTSASSTTSSASSSTGGGGGGHNNHRRGYNRSHHHNQHHQNNNFKFHNFVFNETNQKFCLEEQHGNKKITVTHWKKSADQPQPDPDHPPPPSSTSGTTESSSNQQQQQVIPPKVIRQCDSDSRLIKSERFTIDHLVGRDRDDHRDDDGSGRSKEMGGAAGGITSSASFPLSSSTFNVRPTPFDLFKFDPERLPPPPLPPPPPPQTPPTLIPPLLPPPLATTTTRLPQLNSENSLISSSGHSSGSFLSRLESSSSSNFSNISSSNNSSFRFDTKPSSDNDDSMISKSFFSGGGGGGSSSCCSAINSSLDNLRLNENRYNRTSTGSGSGSGSVGGSGSGGSGLGRQSSSSSSLLWADRAQRRLEADDDSDGDESDHSDSFDAEDFFYRTYRRKLQQRIETLENLIEETIQSQPLDLSINKRDYNNNNDDQDDAASSSKLDSVEDNTTKSGCESEGDSLMSTRLDSPPPPAPPANNRFKSYFDADAPTGGSSSWLSSSRFHLDQQHSITRSEQQQQPPLNLHPDLYLETMRQESLSPSELLSSMNVGCSPLANIEKSTSTPTPTTTAAASAGASAGASASASSFSLSNPFMFPHERTKMFESFEPIISDDHHHHSHHHHLDHHQQQQRHFSPSTTSTSSTTSTATTAAEMFDALVEEEIQKFLQNSPSTSSSSTGSLSSSFTDPFGRNSDHHHHHHHRFTAPHPHDHDHHHHPNDLSRRIEEKLKLLQQEVLHNKLSDGHNFANFLSDHPHHRGVAPERDTPSNLDTAYSSNNMRMHFKFDSNKNLEPYLMDSGGGGGGFRAPSSSSIQHPHSPHPHHHHRQSSFSDSGSTIWNPIMSQQGSTSGGTGGGGGGGPGYLARNRLNHRNQIKRHLEDAFKQNGFLVKTKQVSDANNSAMFCKFRQLRKYTRYYLKSWQNHLPDEVNKLWKGFLPPKSDRPLFLTSGTAHTTATSTGTTGSTYNIPLNDDDDFGVGANLAARAAAAATATTTASTVSEAPHPSGSLSVDASSNASSSSCSSQFTPSME